jgi:hypothetical protein
MPLHVFAWQPEHQAAGLARDALYLIRPDTYVAMVDADGKPDAVDIYFTRHGINLEPVRAIFSARSDNAAHSGDFHES